MTALACCAAAAEWGMLADLVNVFESFLPQLLLYPNPTDPLNGEAAALLMREPEAYAAKIRGVLPLPVPAWTASCSVRGA